MWSRPYDPELAGSQVTLYKPTCLSRVARHPTNTSLKSWALHSNLTELTESTQNVQVKGFETWV